jgi:hypothetical protein
MYRYVARATPSALKAGHRIHRHFTNDPKMRTARMIGKERAPKEAATSTYARLTTMMQTAARRNDFSHLSDRTGSIHG